jgi:ribonucleoside-diphosphate reductase alpha chain
MKRVLNNEDWVLFSPDEVPDLHHVYGRKFEERYKHYERKAERGEIKLWRKIKAIDLWKKMVTQLYETGHPWITFKDPCNIRSPQSHIGTIHSSNLCTEITLNTSRDETAVCNLGSINISNHIYKGKLDRELLQETIKVAMRMLDNVIDLNFYPTPEAENSNLKHRPIGLGLMGFQDALYKMDLQFDSVDAVEFSDDMMEFISFHSILASSEIAREKGYYESFSGSKWDQGLFPIDTLRQLGQERDMEIEVDLTNQLDWSVVKEHVKEYGMRNSNCMAIAPTATIANISDCFPSIEPIYKNIYAKSNLSGEFTMINCFLIQELSKEGLWNREMLEKLKYHDGSVQAIPEISPNIKRKYKEVFEIDPVWLIKHAAVRGKWIDQSQSLNIFTPSVSGKQISDIYFNAWRCGIKTTYYLRTLGASAVEKSTIDINKKFDSVAVASVVEGSVGEMSLGSNVCNVDDEACEACQ